MPSDESGRYMIEIHDKYVSFTKRSEEKPEIEGEVKEPQAPTRKLDPMPQLCLEYLAIKEICRQKKKSQMETSAGMKKLIWWINIIFGFTSTVINIGLAVFVGLYLAGNEGVIVVVKNLFSSG